MNNNVSIADAKIQLFLNVATPKQFFFEKINMPWQIGHVA